MNAKDCFYEKNYKAGLSLFIAENDFYSAGLCALLAKNTKEARNFWKKSENSPASQWGLCVLDIIENKPKKIPSFFQTRAFLEVYLNLFLQNNLIDWAQSLVNACEFLFQANPETYKFIGRALFANGYIDMAIQFCKKSLKIVYTDPESFLILSQCYFIKEDLGEALDLINRVSILVPDYYPAIMFKSIIKEEIETKKRREGKN